MYSYKTCDTDPVTHQVMSSRTILKPAIILNNIMDKIPPEKLAFLQDLAVSEERPSEHVEDSHMEMFNALLRDSPGFFPIHAQGIDLMTGQKRYVYSPCQRDRGQAKSSTASNDAAASSSHKGSCHKTCVASGAGTPCLPFSRRNTAGKHKGLAHCSIPSTCSWVAERKARAETEDLNFHECVTGFPEHTLLHNPLSLTHECKTYLAPWMVGAHPALVSTLSCTQTSTCGWAARTTSRSSKPCSRGQRRTTLPSSWWILGTTFRWRNC